MWKPAGIHRAIRTERGVGIRREGWCQTVPMQWERGNTLKAAGGGHGLSCQFCWVISGGEVDFEVSADPVQHDADKVVLPVLAESFGVIVRCGLFGRRDGWPFSSI